MGRTNYAALLYSQPSLLEGLARVLDVGGVFDCYNASDDADQLAILADWYGSLSDLEQTIQRYSAKAGLIHPINNVGSR